MRFSMSSDRRFGRVEFQFASAPLLDRIVSARFPPPFPAPITVVAARQFAAQHT